MFRFVVFQVGAAIPAARLGALSLICHAGGTVIGGGDGTITLFDNSCKDYAQTELRGGVVAMSFSADQTEVMAPVLFAGVPLDFAVVVWYSRDSVFSRVSAVRW